MKEQKKKNDKNSNNYRGNETSELAFASDTIDTDPLGMWTGVPDNPYEKPVQDADDL